MPGRKASTSPVSSRSARPIVAAIAGSIRSCLPGGAQRTSTGCSRPSLVATNGSCEHGGEPGDVGRRRHRQDAQVGSQVRAGVERQRQAEVGRQVALVDLVEDDEPDAVERRVVLQSAGEHALGDHLDARRPTDVALVAGLVADPVADRLAEQGGHPPGRAHASPAGAVRARRSTVPPATARRAGATERPSSSPRPAGRRAARRGRQRAPRRGRRAPRRRAGRRARRAARRPPGQPRAGVPWNGPGSPGAIRLGADQAVVSAIVSATACQADRVPALGRGRHGAVDAQEDERRQRRQTEALDEGPVGVAEHEELVGQRAEEPAGVGRTAGDHEVDPHVGAAQGVEDARGRP